MLEQLADITVFVARQQEPARRAVENNGIAPVDEQAGAVGMGGDGFDEADALGIVRADGDDDRAARAGGRGDADAALRMTVLKAHLAVSYTHLTLPTNREV